MLKKLFRAAAYLGAGILLGSGLPAFVSAPAQASHCPVGQDIGGTNGDDYLIAPDDQQNLIRGFGGSDYIRGKDCPDDLHGGDGPDNVHGAYGADDIFGGSGHDNPAHCNIIYTYCGELVGGAHSDTIYGSFGGDLLDDTASGDQLDIAQGEDANDTINVRDGDTSDVASGGSGTDSCTVDHGSEKDGTCE